MKVLTTAIVADIRNKLNGTVFAKNRYGLYARNKTTPTNPQTTEQQANRAAFGNVSSGWRSLTQDQRNAWIAAAPNFPITDIFGNTHFLAGNALYTRLNRNLEAIGQTLLTLPPTPVAIPPATAISLLADVSDTDLTIGVDTATQPAGFTTLIYATPLIIPSRLYVKNRLRQIGTAAISTSAIDAYALWNARFGTLIAGQRITVRIALVSNATGQMGVPSEVTTVVVA